MREDQIQNAVGFLNDPQVASSSMDARIKFLESKGLTGEEIQEALKRAQQSPAPAVSTAVGSPAPVSSVPGMKAYPAQYMMQPPPVPKRDWKDYFVMATVSVGVAYGLFEVTRRYVLPMIMPSTPSSLEADKAALELEFDRVEALFEQLQKETSEVLEGEKRRQDEHGSAMESVKYAVKEFENFNLERSKELKSLRSHVESLREMMPRHLDQYREKQDEVIKELQNEVKSLKHLVSSRVKGNGSNVGVPPASMVPSSVTLPRPSAASTNTNPNMNVGPPTEPFIPDPAARSAAPSVASSVPPVTAVPASSAGGPSIPGVTTSTESVTSTPAGIPAWQLNAAKSSE